MSSQTMWRYFFFFALIRQGRSLVIPSVEHFLLQTYLYNCSRYSQLLGVTYNQIQGSINKPNLSVLKLYMYNSTGRYPYDMYNVNSILSSPYFYWDQEVAIVLHGFSNGVNDYTVKTLAASLVRRGGVNVLALDTATLTDVFYLTSLTYLRIIGEALGHALVDMTRAGIRKIHLIGHSLGAHMAGFAGKVYRRALGIKLYRITALSTSGPCYYGNDESMKLSINDAEFIDAIYTDSGYLGSSELIGHANFFPNNANLQPGCSISSFCSHIRSYQFFSESAYMPLNFPSVGCSDWNSFQAGYCSGRPWVFMGYDVPRTARGVFFLKTGQVTPYGLGAAGVIPPPPFGLQMFLNLFNSPQFNFGQPTFLFSRARY